MPIAAVKRSFAVLEALAGERSASGAVALGALARATRLPKPTLHRILRTLNELGYVSQDAESGHYRTTAHLEQLAASTGGPALVRLALPRMERLHKRFNETVNLAVLDGLLVRYLHALETTRPLRHIVAPNAVDAYYTTALGRAIAAFLPPDERKDLLDRTKFRHGASGPARSPERLKKELETTRTRGWSVDEQETDVGVVCYGAPLMLDGRPAGALSVSLPTARLTPQVRHDLTTILREMAHAEL